MRAASPAPASAGDITAAFRLRASTAKWRALPAGDPAPRSRPPPAQGTPSQRRHHYPLMRLARPTARALWPQDDPGQLVGRAQHRIMAGIDHVPARLELVGSAADVGLARIGRAAAVEDVGSPRLVPEPLKLHRAVVDRAGMERDAIGGPFAHVDIEIGEQA